MFNWFQDFWNWLDLQVQAVLDALNVLKLVISIAEFVAGYLPAPDPRLEGLMVDMVAAVVTVTKYIRLFDYFVNMPVLLVVLGIILAVETVLLVLRSWRVIRSFIT